MILAVVGEKGGTGKTTIVSNFAVLRTGEGRENLIVDTDKQSTASYWCFKREESDLTPRIASIQKFGKTVRTEVQALRLKYDDIIIDAGGRDSEEMRAAMLIADVALVPLRASQFDLWTLSRINDLAKEIKEVNDRLRVLVCLNQVSTNPAVKEAEEAKEFFSYFKEISLADSVVCERIAFRKATIIGASIVELEQKDTKAIAEITSLYKEIYNGY